jgi:hypothetical protein
MPGAEPGPAGRKPTSSLVDQNQGCQMVYFQTKIKSLGKFFMVLKWNLSEYFMSSYGHLVYFIVIWYILGSFGIFLVCFTKKNLATLIRTSDIKGRGPSWHHHNIPNYEHTYVRNDSCKRTESFPQLFNCSKNGIANF